MRKICSKCGTEKELCEFYFRKDRNSYENSCKKCKLENGKNNYKKTQTMTKREEKIGLKINLTK